MTDKLTVPVAKDEKVIVSGEKELIWQDIKKALFNAARFSIPVWIIYLTSVVGKLQDPNHYVSLVDFIPSNVTVGSMITWVLNALLDLFYKWQGEVRYIVKKEGEK